MPIEFIEFAMRWFPVTGAIVHEWLSETGGSENVVEVLADVFPDAPIYSLWDDKPGRFEPDRVNETWLARTPLRNHKALALPVMPVVWRHLPYSDADWILCSSHLFAHHARFSGPARHANKFVYVHTPARYIWVPELDGRGNGVLARALSRPLKHLEVKRAQEATSIAANSAFIQNRVEDSWGRDSVVIHPPVSVGAHAADTLANLTEEEAALLERLPTTFVLGASRFVPYKQLDIVIATGVAAGLPVVLAGDGPDYERLRSIADENPGVVTFVPRPSFALLNQLFRRALVYVFPPIEDFGIMPVEVMAAGTPVIANAIGGAAESVVHARTGALVESFDRRELRLAVDIAVAASPNECVNRAWDFDESVFQDKVRKWVGA